MDTRKIGAAKLVLLSLAASSALSGCVAYGPPYAGYGGAPYYSPYGYAGPVYVGPPISLDLGFYGHSHGGRGGRGWR